MYTFDKKLKNMDTLQKNTIGEYVAQDFRTAALFSKYKIDFCCKGNKTLDEVCEAKGLDINKIENEINTVLNLYIFKLNWTLSKRVFS